MRLIPACLLLLAATAFAEPIYELKNLAAWCIVPFDDRKRVPKSAPRW